jgi:hypothetical protein
MKNRGLICVCALAMALILPSVCAQAVKTDSSRKNEYLAGTVLQVQRHDQDSTSNYVGDSPSDAPLRSGGYAYDISIRVNCATYVGRWNSELDSVSAVFSPNRAVQVRLEKHVMYVDVPGEKEFRMGFVARPRGQSAPCSTDH